VAGGDDADSVNGLSVQMSLAGEEVSLLQHGISRTTMLRGPDSRPPAAAGTIQGANQTGGRQLCFVTFWRQTAGYTAHRI